MKNRSELSLVFLVLLGISLILHWNYLNEFPRFIHAWTQSDRYALSLGFLDNGFDFFHPSSFNLRPDPTFEYNTETGITPVDPPVPEFIVALFMKATGTTSPIVFRLYSILISCLGLTMLYALLKEKALHYSLRILAVEFMFFAPVYFYYTAGFIPTTSAVSFAMIGLYFFYKNRTHHSRWPAFFFFTLAALVRTPFLFPLLIAGFLEFRRERKYIPFIISLTVFAGFKLWNDHLAGLHGSMFLRKLMHAEDVKESLEYVKISWENWGTSYFSIIHYIVAAVILLLVFIFRRRNSGQSGDPMILFGSLWLTGSLIYYFLMQAQYLAHDYYFLDSFFLPLIILVISCLFRINDKAASYKNVTLVIVLIFVATAGYVNADIQKARRTTGPWDRTEATYQNFIGAKDLLDELKVPADARILVIDAYTVNGPLIQMNRKGYTILNTNEKTIPEALSWNYDLVVIQDDYVLSDVVRMYPAITGKLTKIGGNGKISVFKRSSEEKSQSFRAFFALDDKKMLGEVITDSCVFNADTEFGCNTDIPVNSFKNETVNYVHFSADAFVPGELKEIVLVCNINDQNGSHLLYKTFALKDYAVQGEQKLEFLFPFRFAGGSSFKVYINDPGKDDRIILRNIVTSWFTL